MQILKSIIEHRTRSLHVQIQSPPTPLTLPPLLLTVCPFVIPTGGRLEGGGGQRGTQEGGRTEGDTGGREGGGGEKVTEKDRWLITFPAHALRKQLDCRCKVCRILSTITCVCVCVCVMSHQHAPCPMASVLISKGHTAGFSIDDNFKTASF